MQPILSSFLKINDFYESLKTVESDKLEQPIADGKWSVNEIIAHLNRWDVYLIEKGIPNVLLNQEINFPSFKEYNDQSAEFAKTMSVGQMLDDSIEKREVLVRLFEENWNSIETPIKLNGHSHDSKTNRPFTLLFLIEDFIEHDEHHLKQIRDYLGR